MSTWANILKAYRVVRAAAEQDEGIPESWQAFKATVAASADNPPYHLRLILDLLDEVRGNRPKSEVRILDHGCGGAATALYLLACGYEGVHGVDVYDVPKGLDRLVNGHLSLTGRRFLRYDGKKLPFEDSYFDLIFSNQVVEHVHPDMLDSYYIEERRTIAPGGIVYHQVPHRLVPYDSHSRTWILHYLPRNTWFAILRLIGRNTRTYDETMFLRWPWIHRRLVKRHLGSLEDRTMDRFVGHSDLSDYEGPQRLRRWLGNSLRIPFVGWVGRKVLKNFVMIDTVSRIRATDGYRHR
jgi:SAM-dependent methyltransferase